MNAIILLDPASRLAPAFHAVTVLLAAQCAPFAQRLVSCSVPQRVGHVSVGGGPDGWKVSKGAGQRVTLCVTWGGRRSGGVEVVGGDTGTRCTR